MENSQNLPVIVLLTVNKHETHAVLDAFVGHDKSPDQQIIKGITYNRLGNHGGHTIIHALCEMGAGGVGAAQSRTRQAIDAWNPEAIIAVGIAFGIDEKTQDIGDVLVSTQIQSYELCRIGKDIITPRADKPSCSGELLNLLKQTDYREDRRPDKDSWPVIRFGLMLSGEKLIDNHDFLENLKKQFPEAIGGEMEGSGVYTSAHEKKVDWIIVKAICDWAYDKNSDSKEESQKKAAQNSAKVIKAALDKWPIHFSKTNRAKASENNLGKKIDNSPLDPNIKFEIFRYAPPNLIGREEELNFLESVWEKSVHSYERPRILTFVAMGGEGKTSLVAKWVENISHRNWRGCEALFAWSFYSQGSKAYSATSSDTFFREALIYFGDAEMADSSINNIDKARRLTKLIGEKRAILILDGLEPLQHPPTSQVSMPGELKDKGVSALLKGLALANKGLCVVTTRLQIYDLNTFKNSNVTEITLSRLSPEAGEALLKDLGVHGPRAEFEELVEDVKGHALTLHIMGRYLRSAHSGDIRCRDRVSFEKADAKVQGGHAFRVISVYEKWMQQDSDESRRQLAVLRLLGLFDRPASSECLSEFRRAPAILELTEPLMGVTEEDFNFSLDALENARLLTVHRHMGGSLIELDTHPLIREYFASRIENNHSDTFRKAHRRLYEYLCKATEEGEEPTLETLQPLYQAVRHGCNAGLRKKALKDVYQDRILRLSKVPRGDFYSTEKLGSYNDDLGAIACFFDHPWKSVSTDFTRSSQSWLLTMAASILTALGRLNEALEPLQVGLEVSKKVNITEAAKDCSSLSGLQLKLGNLTESIKLAKRAVLYASASTDRFQIIARQSLHAIALHHAGRYQEAHELFFNGNLFQNEEKILDSSYQREPFFDFAYCDFLLFEAEREAWRVTRGPRTQALIDACDQIYELSSQALNVLKKNSAWLKMHAEGHLIVGRTVLIRAILERADFQSPISDITHIDLALDFLRRAAQLPYIPTGLLTRAWLRSLTGNFADAQSDLNEAWEIAKYIPMPLVMADIYLYRARLLFRQNPYPWGSPLTDLAEARRLIEKHGYWRRKEELEDAEKDITAILSGDETR